MSSFGRQRARFGTIAMGGLTPLLDTIFLLLFALLALSDARTAERNELLRIELPEVEAGGDAAPAAPRRLALEIDADSRVLLLQDGEELPVTSREELDEALARLVGDAMPEEVVIEIHADRDARHGTAVELLQHLRLRGFVTVQLVAQGLEGMQGPFGGSR